MLCFALVSATEPELSVAVPCSCRVRDRTRPCNSAAPNSPMAASAQSSSNHSWFGLLGFKMVCILSFQKCFLFCGLSLRRNFQVHPQRFQPSVVIVSCIGQRFSQYVCDFLQSAALKVHHLDGLSLSGIQFTNAALHEPGPLASVHARYVVG